MKNFNEQSQKFDEIFYRFLVNVNEALNNSLKLNLKKHILKLIQFFNLNFLL